MQEFISVYVDFNMPYEDALKLAERRDKDAALNIQMSLELGAAVQARLEKI